MVEMSFLFIFWLFALFALLSGSLFVLFGVIQYTRKNGSAFDLLFASAVGVIILSLGLASIFVYCLAVGYWVAAMKCAVFLFVSGAVLSLVLRP